MQPYQPSFDLLGDADFIAGNGELVKAGNSSQVLLNTITRAKREAAAIDNDPTLSAIGNSQRRQASLRAITDAAIKISDTAEKVFKAAENLLATCDDKTKQGFSGGGTSADQPPA